MEIVRLYLECGADPDAADYDMRTGLHIACAEGLIPMVKLFVKMGGSISFKCAHIPNRDDPLLHPGLPAALSILQHQQESRLRHLCVNAGTGSGRPLSTRQRRATSK